MRDGLLSLWGDAGIDPADAFKALAEEREFIAERLQRQGRGRMGPISGFVIPTLRAIGLYSDRIAGHFAGMFEANFGAETSRRIQASTVEVPEDLEAWVEDSGSG